MSQGSLFDPGTPPFERSAVLSPCGLYRYALARSWGVGCPVNFVMLNPSVADASVDDPTIKRCSAYARSWGYPALSVTNLYALRATDPRELWKHPAPVGPENDDHLGREAKAAALVLCAWGNGGDAVWRKGRWTRGRGWVFLHRLAGWGLTPHALRVTAACMPAHPLYLPSSLTPRTLDDCPGPEALWLPAGFDPGKDGDQ